MAQKHEGNAGRAEERLDVLKADHQAVLDCVAALTRGADVMQTLFAQIRHNGPATPLTRALLCERFNDFEASQRDLRDAMQRAQRHDDQVRTEYLAARQRRGRSGVTTAFGFTEVLARDVTLRRAKCVASPGIGTGEPGGPREELATACTAAMGNPKDRQELAANMRDWVKEKGGEFVRELRLEIEQIDKLKAEVEAEYLDVLGVLTGRSNGTAVGIPPGIETGRGKGNGGTDEFRYARFGSGYFIAGFGEHGPVPKRKGFDHIAMLVKNPKQPVLMRALLQGENTATAADPQSRQPALDEQARRELYQRLQEVKGDLERARGENDSVEQHHCEDEIAKLNGELKAAVGLGGRDRDLNSEADRLRPSVRANLARAYRALREAVPPMKELADHFEAAISAEGATYVYRPVGNSPAWSSDPPPEVAR